MAGPNTGPTAAESKRGKEDLACCVVDGCKRLAAFTNLVVEKDNLGTPIVEAVCKRHCNWGIRK